MTKEEILRELQIRNLPNIPEKASWQETRAWILSLFQQEEYGWMPDVPVEVSGQILAEDERPACGNAVYQKIAFTMRWAGGEHTFPIYLVLPKEKAKATFLHIAFPLRDPVHTMPYEEMAERGFAIAAVEYVDITSDDGDFDNGLAGAWYQGRQRGPEDPGKIALWAWALTKVIDYLETLPLVNTEKIAVVGHSRLGKTALFTGLMDERIALTISNDSGCSGASLNHGKQVGETIEVITRVFPYWFNEKYLCYSNHEEEMTWDQHFLLAGIAPRRVYVASAAEDSWADPLSEQTAAEAAREVFAKLGLCRSFIGSHVRPGGHALARQDWLHYMDYIDKYMLDSEKKG